MHHLNLYRDLASAHELSELHGLASELDRAGFRFTELAADEWKTAAVERSFRARRPYGSWTDVWRLDCPDGASYAVFVAGGGIIVKMCGLHECDARQMKRHRLAAATFAATR